MGETPRPSPSERAVCRICPHACALAEGEVGLSFQIRDLFAIGFAFGIPVLKWLLRWKKEKKLREEAQKAENPEKPQEPVTNDEKSA